MRNELLLTVIGNLVDDPELRFTSAGVPVARFTVASTPRVFDRDTNAWRDGERRSWTAVRGGSWRRIWRGRCRRGRGWWWRARLADGGGA